MIRDFMKFDQKNMLDLEPFDAFFWLVGMLQVERAQNSSEVL